MARKVAKRGRKKAPPKRKAPRARPSAKKKPGKTTKKKPKKAPRKKRKAPSGRPKVAKPAQKPPPKRLPEWPPPEDARALIDTLDLVRRVLMSADTLFLGRQVAYHLAAQSDLPMTWADPDHLSSVLGKLVEHLVRRSPRRSAISMELSVHSLRSGPGIEIRIASLDPHLEDMDASTFMAKLYSTEIDPVSKISLAKIREALSGMNGRMWVNLPKPNRPIYHIVLPTTDESSDVPRSDHQTFKYDIQIINYASVRKRFGIKKSMSLVDQIERYVKSLVRYPMDMVMSAGDKGMVTTIYETQGGGGESVASRISQRLGREEFHIGRKPVELSFRYRLSALCVTPADETGTTKKGR